MNILGEIAENKRRETDMLAATVPLETVRKKGYFERETFSLSACLADDRKAGIIAEFKRKSPSKGILNDSVSVRQVTSGYCASGASALSVLTDNKYFGGTSDDLMEARAFNDLPILRKDFIISEYQVFESKAIGADAILLIASILSGRRMRELARLARSLGLEVLMEVHDARELSKLNEYVDIIGVNNRNLDTFEVDISASLGLADKIPGNLVKISESGISSPGEIRILRDAGYRGFLMGERFMTSADPVPEFEKFMKSLNP